MITVQEGQSTTGPSPMTEAELQQLDAAYVSSSQGEWSDDKGLLWIPSGGLLLAGMGTPGKADATFCARVHNDWPRVMATIQQLTRERDLFRDRATAIAIDGLEHLAPGKGI